MAGVGDWIDFPHGKKRGQNRRHTQLAWSEGGWLELAARCEMPNHSAIQALREKDLEFFFPFSAISMMTTVSKQDQQL